MLLEAVTPPNYGQFYHFILKLDIQFVNHLLKLSTFSLSALFIILDRSYAT